MEKVEVKRTVIRLMDESGEEIKKYKEERN